MPSVLYASGGVSERASFCVFTTTLTGWLEVTVTAYCLPSMRPGAPTSLSSEFGSTNLLAPAGIDRWTVTLGAVPSEGMNRAVTAGDARRGFWTMHAVTCPKHRC